MANLIRISRTSPDGRKVLNAIEMLKTAYGTLSALDGARLQAIGASPGEMQNLFGVDSAANAQALSDRWGAFLADWNSSPTITDFVDATFEGEAQT